MCKKWLSFLFRLLLFLLAGLGFRSFHQSPGSLVQWRDIRGNYKLYICRLVLVSFLGLLLGKKFAVYNVQFIQATD